MLKLNHIELLFLNKFLLQQSNNRVSQTLEQKKTGLDFYMDHRKRPAGLMGRRRRRRRRNISSRTQMPGTLVSSSLLPT
jgi:hypothetical protein